MDYQNTFDMQAKKFAVLGINGWDKLDPDAVIAQAEQLECDGIELFSVIMLTTLGLGNFDEESGSSEFVSDDLYAFDAEVMSVSTMYTDFIKQAARISRGGFKPERVRERGNLSTAPRDDGAGTEFVTVFVRGKKYEYKAEVHDDWFDDGVIDFLNNILREQGCEKQFFGLFDGMQGIMLFFNTEEWQNKLLEAVQGK